MLKGIDISSWQGDINPAALPIDFCIVKATEGVNYVNPYCDGAISQCKAGDKLWGFYHFANENDPKLEAEYFIANCANYFGDGIPVLDWEGNQSVSWVNTFVNFIHNETGIWPWIYGNPWRFRGETVELNCARWLAQYPLFTRPTLDIDPGETPQVPGLVAAWQFASDGQVSGYDGNLDLNHFYGDREAWLAYARGGAKVVEKPNSIILENDKYKVEITPK